MSKKVIVIGGTAAGLSAASKARRVDPEIEVTVFEKTGYISYGACGLPYFVGGLIGDKEELISLTPDDARNKRGILVYTRREVTSIRRGEHRITVTNLENGEITEHAYDKLVIATGARPVRPDIPGARLPNVYCLRTVEDGIALKKAAVPGKTAAIIGGGFIGLEMAEALTGVGVRTHLFEAQQRLLPFMEERFSDLVKEELLKHGVCVHMGAMTEAVLEKDGMARGVRTADGKETSADFVLMSIGVAPASELAAGCGLSLGMKNGIVVDEEMRTSDPDIFACGDCVQMKNRLTGRAAYAPLGTTANKQGRVAGGNLAGGHDFFPGVIGSMIVKVFDLYLASTGLTISQARAAGYDAAAASIMKGDRASYYPGGRETLLCLITDRKTGRVLGAQAAGGASVAGRVNTLAAAVTAGMTAREISELDLVYAPPVAPVYDPVLIAAAQAAKQVSR